MKKRLLACVTFDVDAMSGLVARGLTSATPVSRGEFDAVAVPRILKTGKAAGILAPVEEDAKHWLKLGCTYVAVGSDLGILARGTEALAAKFKA